MILPRFFVESDIKISVTHLTPSASKADPVVVLCHPTGFCANIYSSITAHLRNINAFAIDMRSHGFSERGDVTEWTGFAKDLEQACKRILEITGVKKIIGVGISSGASAHILNAASNKDLYAGIYLSEPILFPPGMDLSSRAALADSAKNRRDTFSSRDEAYNRYSERGPLSKLSKSALALYCTHGFKDAEEGVTLCCKKEDEEQIYKSGSANNVFDALKEVDCPSVIAHGELSTTVDRNHAELIGRELKSLEVKTLDNVGHFTLLEDSVMGAAEITEFIKLLNKD